MKFGKAYPLKGLVVECHILQSFPPVCLNRDDMGAPKSAVMGGVPRIRVSSQCWKRAVRTDLHEAGAADGIRTKKIAFLVAEACRKKGASSDQAERCGTLIGSALASNELFFISPHEIEALAAWAESRNFELPASKPKPKSKGRKAADADSGGDGAADVLEAKAKSEAVACLLPGGKTACALDVAIFGRMAAQAQMVAVDGAACFSHAVTTHACDVEFDYFTALDDFEDGAASAHLGENEFASGTFYRYVSLDVGLLKENLGGDACGAEELQNAVRSFLHALYRAVPSARQNTFSGACPWDYARILVRRGHRLQASFERPVRAAGEGWLKPSIEVLEETLARHECGAGSLYGKLADARYDGTPNHGIDDVCNAVREALEKCLTE